MVGGDDGGTERSGSGATPFRTLDLGWRLGTMVVRSEATPFRTLDLGWRLGTMVVPERSGSGATPFRMLDLGWLVGVVGGWPERSDSGATWTEFWGGWSGVTVARPVRWEKPKGGKAPAAQSRSSLSRKENTAPKN